MTCSDLSTCSNRGKEDERPGGRDVRRKATGAVQARDEEDLDQGRNRGNREEEEEKPRNV